MSTDVSQVISELGGGQFESQVSHVLSEVAGSVIDHNRAGQVQITLDFKKINGTGQVHINHTVKYKRPTSHGSRTEDVAATTPMYVGPKGRLSFFPENQHQMFDKQGNLNTPK